MSVRIASVTLLVVAGTLFTAGLSVAQNDPAAQFSPTSNPVSVADGKWSYGYENVPLPNPYNPAPIPVPYGAINAWQTASFGFVGVLDNPTPVNQNFVTASDGAVFAPNEIAMHPGPNDQYGIIQFTASVSGNYLITGTFQGIDTSGATNTDVRLLYNNATVASGSVVGDGIISDVPLTAGPFFLNAGDTLAYAVGGTPVFGTTALVPGTAFVAAEAVPEPSTLVLAGAALAFLAACRLRRWRA